MSTPTPGTPATSHCSFCGKRPEEVKLLIAGPDGVCICDECVDGLWMIVHKRRGRRIYGPSLQRAHLR